MQHANPGLQRRFREKFHFDNYKKDELMKILKMRALRAHATLPEDVAASAAALLEKESMLRNFGNADAAGALFDRLQSAAIARTEGTRAAAPLAITAEDLDALQRADAAKEKGFLANEHLAKFVTGLARQVALAQAAALPPPPLPHVLFTGNPGTGKTSSARYLGHLLHKAGLLPKGHVVETTGEELVGSFVGQTKDRVRDLLLESSGGILFVDEAHRLGGRGGGSFKQEALGALLTGMTSEEFKNKLMVVFAGYEAPLRALLAADPGLTRRFTATVNFPDLAPREAEAKLAYVLGREGKPKTLAREALSSAEREGAVAAAFKRLRAANEAAWGNLGDVATFAKRLFKVAGRRVAKLVAAERAGRGGGGGGGGGGGVGGVGGAGAAPAPAAVREGLWDMVYTLRDVEEVGEAFVQERLGLSTEDGEGQ
jgi:hypothetical protein